MTKKDGQYFEEAIVALRLPAEEEKDARTNAENIVGKVLVAYEENIAQGHVGAGSKGIPSGFSASGVNPHALTGLVYGRIQSGKTRAMIASELEDSPRSFAGPGHMVVMYLTGHQPAKALEAYRAASAIYDVTLPWLQIQGAEAAFETGHAALADSLLDRVDLICRPCDFFYRYEASVARARGYPTAADSFAARVGRAPDPRH